MKEVTVDESCVGCGSCVEVCPEVFELEDDLAIVKKGADLSLDAKIIEAADACPVEAIHYEK
jgi:ferredoxin